MKTRTWTFSFCVLIAITFQTQANSAQEQAPVPDSVPSLNPIDPAALNAAPAFGDSGPVSKPQNAIATAPAELAAKIWIPKLRVVLVTSMTEHTEVLVHTFGTNGNLSAFPSAGPKPVVQKTTRTVDIPSQSSVILTCDDVNVEVISSADNKSAYSFSCKSHALLSIDGYTVSGDSISASEGKLTITNAVIRSDQATMSSEKMILQLPILAVQVGAANPSDPLKPTPDPIGVNRRSNTHEKFEADKPYDRGVPFPSKDVFSN